MGVGVDPEPSKVPRTPWDHKAEREVGVAGGVVTLWPNRSGEGVAMATSITLFRWQRIHETFALC